MENYTRFEFMLRTLRILAILFAIWYLHSRGIPPFWAAGAAVCGAGLFRTIYTIVCFTITALIMTAIVGFIIF